MTLSRRSLLRGAAGAAVALPVLDAMLTIGGRMPKARGAEPTAPRKLIIFFTGNGILMEKWRCTPGPTPASFTFSSILEPIAHLRESCLFLDGIAYKSAKDPNNQNAQGHPAGTVSALTGYYAAPGNMYGGNTGVNIGYSLGPSVDFAISRHLGTATRFPAYYVGAQCNSANASVARRCFYTDTMSPIVPVENPAMVFDQLFGELDVGGGNVALRQRIDARKLVLGSVREQMRALRCKLSADDRVRLDRHEEQLVGMAERLDRNGTGAGCMQPTIDGDIQLVTPNLEQITRNQNELIAMALGCDLTRVIGYQVGISDSGHDQNFAFVDIANQHQTSHLKMKNPAGDGEVDDPTAKAKLEALGRFQAGVLADLVAKLEAMPDVEGSVFDNTTIVWMSEIGNSWSHDTNSVAVSLIGNGGGYFDTGRYLQVGSQVSHNRFLLHLLHYMGLDDVGTFGAPGNYNDGGPLAGIVA